MLKAVISGAGQDASYLADLLLEQNYQVIMFSKRISSASNVENIKHHLNNNNFTFLDGDITNPTFISRILHDYQPHEYYGTAASSHVGYSFQNPQNTLEINAIAVINQLELIRQISPYTRFLNCASSEIFGGINCPKEGFNESANLNPRSPYAISKVTAYHTTKHYREAYGLHASSSICFNHSSPRRGHTFATRKITRGLAQIKLGKQSKLKMGDLSPFRDEGHAKDYCQALILMLKQPNPDDYVIATGDGATIEEMFKYTCELAGLNFEDVYEQDPQFFRPSEVQYLLGDASKARSMLGWSPKYTWKDLLKEMYYYDLTDLKI